MVQKFDLDKENTKIATEIHLQEQLREMKEEEDALETEEFDESEMLTETEKRLNRDIFEDVVNKTIENGGEMLWTLYKDNCVVISCAEHSYSWAKVHKRFGSGNYQLRPRFGTGGKWAPSQKQRFGDYDGGTQDKAESENFSMNSILDWQTRQQESERENRRLDKAEQQERDEKQEQRMNDLFDKKNSDNSSMNDMFMMMMKNQQSEQNRRDDEYRRKEEQRREDEREQRRTDREDQIRATDLRREEKKEADDRFEKLLAGLSGKKDTGITAIEHFEKIEKAKREARKEAREEAKEIEEKAEKRALEIAAAGGDDDKSITDKAVEAALSSLPSMAQFFVNKSAPVNKKAPEFVETRVSKGRKVRRAAKPQVIQGEVVPQGAKFAGMEQPPQAKPKKPNLSDDQKMQVLRKAISETISPVILSSLMEEEGYIQCFTKSSEELTKRKINIKLVVKLFTKEKLIDLFAESGLIEIARSKDQEDELLSWIDGYYAEFAKA